jgi:ABC-2 type transport system permease protein
MHNYWLVARHEYQRMVFRRSFFVLTLAIPLAMVAFIALIIFVETRDSSDLPIGYVDPTGLLVAARHAELPDAENRIQVQPFSDVEASIAALEGDQVQAVFVLPENYPANLAMDLYYLENSPSDDAWGDFDDFLRVNLVAAYPDAVADRLFAGPEIIVIDLASGREFSDSAIINVILPFVASFFFFIATMSASGFMLQVVADEKENRTMEIILTSLTPGQLIGGKTLGLLAASLTQLAIYLLTVVLGVAIASVYVPELQAVVIPWGYLGVVALFFFPSYALIAAIMVAIGSAVTELQQGQQLAGILNLLFMAPLILTFLFFENPNGPAVIFMSLFPTTAFMTISLRWGLGTVPLWQLGLSWVLLVSTTLLMIWAAARIFRVGMLRYGQPLNLKAAVEAVRNA